MEDEIVEELHRRFEYKDGKLYYKVSVRPAKVGDTPKHNMANKGYIDLCVKGKRMYAHQAIFVMHHNYLPTCVDHIDGDKFNNRIENLQDADKSVNSLNRDSKGCYFNKSLGYWVSRLTINGVTKVNYFDTEEKAKNDYTKRKTQYAANAKFVLG